MPGETPERHEWTDPKTGDRHAVAPGEIWWNCPQGKPADQWYGGEAIGIFDEAAVREILRLVAERNEAVRKGEEVCCAYGNALVEIHDLKRGRDEARASERKRIRRELLEEFNEPGTVEWRYLMAALDRIAREEVSSGR